MIQNPLWERQIAISKVQLEVMLMELQMEFEQGASVYGVKNNGTKIYSSREGQPANPSQEVRDVTADPTSQQRNQNVDGGANSQSAY